LTLGYGSDEWDTDTSSQGFSRGVEGRGPGRFRYGETPSQQLAQPDGIGALPMPEKRFAATAQLLSVQHNRRLSVRCFAADDDLPRMSSLTDIWPGSNWFGLAVSTTVVAHVMDMALGALIVFFLIVEPHGLAKLCSIGKQKLRLWPFPH